MKTWENFGDGISSCGRYRYALSREWIGGGRLATFVMLNPSTADHRIDDPTIRRCLSFATREGCSRLRVVNLYAWRATSPRELLAAEDSIGPENDRAIAAGCEGADFIVAAWGTNARPGRAADVLRLIGRVVACLGTNADGTPKHPLYLPNSAPLVTLPAG